jgi:hypothetical protein
LDFSNLVKSGRGPQRTYEPCRRMSASLSLRPRHDQRDRQWYLVPYPNAFFTRSSVNGACRSRTPVSAMTALETAGVINGVAIWPTPVG